LPVKTGKDSKRARLHARPFAERPEIGYAAVTTDPANRMDINMRPKQLIASAVTKETIRVGEAPKGTHGLRGPSASTGLRWLALQRALMRGRQFEKAGDPPMTKFTMSSAPVSAERIEAVEKKLGVKLPGDYRRFLRTTNGGAPSAKCFTVPGRGGALCDYLYGIRQKREAGDLQWEQEQASLWDPLPAGFVAIGHDPGGNLLLMATLGEDVGQIYFWDQDGLWVEEDGENTFPVAKSFGEFVAGLSEKPSTGDATASRP
jgi:hypothetical protein